jgi:hypothetical protein
MKAENKKALETKKCPRCGKPLHFRYVLGETSAISRDEFELYCLAGHSFNFLAKEVMREKAEGLREERKAA